MATRGSRNQEPAAAELPSAIPFDVPRPTRLSWALGSRTVSDEAATLAHRWTDTAGGWRLAVFDVTDETVLLRVRTPVGRERFYGAAKLDLDGARAALDADARWRRVE
ncbi:hypothetical protein [Halorientalis halophila]|uniref:hypothetical protein n=1 Tax=Halorientalis halophila TaxID=3108499 RepID=UPI0030087903